MDVIWCNHQFLNLAAQNCDLTLRGVLNLQILYVHSSFQFKSENKHLKLEQAVMNIS